MHFAQLMPMQVCHFACQMSVNSWESTQHLQRISDTVVHMHADSIKLLADHNTSGRATVQAGTLKQRRQRDEGCVPHLQRRACVKLKGDQGRRKLVIGSQHLMQVRPI